MTSSNEISRKLLPRNEELVAPLCVLNHFLCSCVYNRVCMDHEFAINCYYYCNRPATKVGHFPPNFGKDVSLSGATCYNHFSPSAIISGSCRYAPYYQHLLSIVFTIRIEIFLKQNILLATHIKHCLHYWRGIDLLPRKKLTDTFWKFSAFLIASVFFFNIFL